MRVSPSILSKDGWSEGWQEKERTGLQVRGSEEDDNFFFFSIAFTVELVGFRAEDIFFFLLRSWFRIHFLLQGTYLVQSMIMVMMMMMMMMVSMMRRMEEWGKRESRSSSSPPSTTGIRYAKKKEMKYLWWRDAQWYIHIYMQYKQKIESTHPPPNGWCA